MAEDQAFIAFIKYNPYRNVWHGCNDVTLIFNAKEDDVRYVSTTEELIGVLELEFPACLPHTTRLKFIINELVEVYDEAGLYGVRDHAKIIEACKMAGDIGVPIDNEMKDVPDVICKSNVDTICKAKYDIGGFRVFYDPKKYKTRVLRMANKAKKALAKALTFTHIANASYQLKTELFPKMDADNDLTPFAPVRWVFDDEVRFHHDPLERFLGFIMIAEKFLGKAKVRKSKALKPYLEQWKRNPKANRDEFMQFGKRGEMLVSYFEEVLKIKPPVAVG